MDSLKEFISKGGVQILSAWAKDIKDDVLTLKQCQRDSARPDFETQFSSMKRLFLQLITYLDVLPIDWNLLKKTKIGKAVNSALKAQLFEAEILD